MKKIGLISDTHGHYDSSYEKYLKECDEIWHAGDIGKIEVMDKLAYLAPVKGVYGNIDSHEIRTVYPEKLRFNCEGVDVMMIHIGGQPYVYTNAIREELKENPPGLFICGHSHLCKVQMDKRLNTLYMNPGAAGIHGFHKVRTLLRFELDEGEIRNLEVVELGPRSRAKTSE